MGNIAGQRKGETYPSGGSGGSGGSIRLIDSGSSDVADNSTVILGPFTRATGERIGFFIYPSNMQEGEHWGGEGTALAGTMEIAWRFLRNEIADPATQFNVQIAHASGTGTPRTVEWAVYAFPG